MHVTDNWSRPAAESANVISHRKSRNHDGDDGKEGVVGSNPTEGLASQRGIGALDGSTDEPQPSTTPASAPSADPATRLLNDAIAAYATCTRPRRNSTCSCPACAYAGRQLGDAWRLVSDEAMRTISGRVREPDRRDDALQLAFLKLWQAVRNYNREKGPVVSAAAFARWAADKTALNVVEKRDQVAEREHGALDDDVMRDIIEYRADQVRGSGLDDEQAVADYAKLVAERAPNRDRGKIWAAIVLAAGAGHVDRKAMSEYVSAAIGREIPEVSIRREIWHMVREAPHPRDGIGKVEVLEDWRTSEPVVGDGGELSLFDYSWQEIS